MHITLCPVCKSMIDIAKPLVGAQLECPDCGEVFQVVKLEPLEVYCQAPLEDEPLPEVAHRFSQR